MNSQSAIVICSQSEPKTASPLNLKKLRRKNPERITKESILKWVWEVIGDNSDLNNFYFIQVEM